MASTRAFVPPLSLLLPEALELPPRRLVAPFCRRCRPSVATDAVGLLTLFPAADAAAAALMRSSASLNVCQHSLADRLPLARYGLSTVVDALVAIGLVCGFENRVMNSSDSEASASRAVSYTHLTLPTILLV